ncbi:hypothetical protein GCM10022415_22710 [Knoellia locipacati]|uniref:Uncharacterized protein n=1 Tax=Knoellia locipacati TaxID=882824 RepID=A0A512T203_9MICO|nr:hypothetical protein KLO01_22670 [Knoellia locipacati]
MICGAFGTSQGTRSPFRPRSRGVPMSKRARKRRSRKGNKANHGRKPNA